MDLSFKDEIERLKQAIAPGSNLTFHPSTIYYIESILEPYNEAMKNATTIDQLIDWIPLAFPEPMRTQLLNIVEGVKAMILNEETQISVAKDFIINFFLHEFVEKSYETIFGSIVLPWDIINIINHKRWNSIFNVTSSLLYINIWLNDEEYTHEVSFELAMGILAFKLNMNYAYDVVLFGSQLESKIVLDRFTHEDLQQFLKYRIWINGTTEYIYFDTAEFMQGFISGSLWIGINPHDLIISLDFFDSNNTDQWIPINFI
jgi:hypothetical protein